MKKISLLLATMLAAANLCAQVYVGGGLGVHIYSGLWGNNLEKFPSIQVTGRVNQGRKSDMRSMTGFLWELLSHTSGTSRMPTI